jgi:hypothetical protein
MRLPLLIAVVALLVADPAHAQNRFKEHGSLRVAKSGTYLEHADGTPFFFLADTVWTGPALSTANDWKLFLQDRVAKKFTAIQFNAISPWRTAPTDAEGRVAYTVEGGQFRFNEDYFKRLDERMTAINDAGLLAAYVLTWAHKKGDSGTELSDEHVIELCKYQVARYGKHQVLWILAGDNRYDPQQSERWKKIGRAVFADKPDALVTTHPTGMNWPWESWLGEKWFDVLGYQSGHGDDGKALAWIHSGPVSQSWDVWKPARPIINLEPPYEDHFGYQSKKPHSAYNVRRAVYWSLLSAPVAGVTYGGHGVWSWHTKPGEPPTDHPYTGVAKTWKEAMNLPGSGHMKVVAEVFGSLPWMELRPAPKLLKEQPGIKDPTDFISVAATPKQDWVIIYCPKAATDLRVIGDSFGEATKFTWVDPLSGRKIDASLNDLEAGTAFLKRKDAKPEDMDVVLLLHRPEKAK